MSENKIYNIFNKKIPHEIIIHILEYSVERMKEDMLYAISKSAILNEYTNINTRWSKYTTHTIGADFAIPYTFIVSQCCSETEHSINILSKCSCCSRHNTNKPKILSWKELELKDHKLNKYEKCNCPCRHYSRWIVRAFCDYSL